MSPPPGDKFAGLLVQAQRFRDWAATVPQKSAEWECGYDHWQDAYDLLETLLPVPPEEWTTEAANALLYLLARDHEIEWIAEVLSRVPSLLAYVSEASFAVPEPQARWQLAVQLAAADPPPDEAAALLTRFARDEDEYVRRRALTALGKIRSQAVDDLVDEFWRSNDEYARMAVLEALDAIDSKRLREFLARADDDGRAYLVAFADRIREFLA